MNLKCCLCKIGCLFLHLPHLSIPLLDISVLRGYLTLLMTECRPHPPDHSLSPGHSDQCGPQCPVPRGTNSRAQCLPGSYPICDFKLTVILIQMRWIGKYFQIQILTKVTVCVLCIAAVFSPICSRQLIISLVLQNRRGVSPVIGCRQYFEGSDVSPDRSHLLLKPIFWSLNCFSFIPKLWLRPYQFFISNIFKNPVSRRNYWPIPGGDQPVL